MPLTSRDSLPTQVMRTKGEPADDHSLHKKWALNGASGVEVALHMDLPALSAVQH